MPENGLSERLHGLERQLKIVEDYVIKGFWTTLDKMYATSLPSRTLSCIICSHTAQHGAFEKVVDQCIFGGGTLERYKCQECDTIFGPMKYLDLPEDVVSLDYALLYSRYSEADLTEVEIHAFESLKPTKAGRYLNWGCGAWSKSVQELRAQGWDVTGYEPSAGAVAGEYVVTKREELSPPYDGIFSNNVIEHFRDPIGQFREFAALLSEDGAMAHSSPCYVYCYGYTRFHVYFPIGRSIEELASRTGFEVADRSNVGQYMNVGFRRTR
ncbi:class I SAM-dependent methyltransferase [Bradyrhizobium sp. USDA 4529]